MLENKKIILIITTRNYPSVVWNNSCELKWDFEQLDFNDKNLYSESKGDIFQIKKLSFEDYTVFVVPCLTRNVTDEDRRGYLENVISTICPNLKEVIDDVYLVAHDGDFNKSEKGAIVTEKDVPRGDTLIPLLSELVKHGHVYMFHHDNPVISILLTKITEYDDDGVNTEFGIIECQQLVFDIVEPERTMRKHFQSINLNVKNRYPEIKKQ